MVSSARGTWYLCAKSAEEANDWVTAIWSLKEEFTSKDPDIRNVAGGHEQGIDAHIHPQSFSSGMNKQQPWGETKEKGNQNPKAQRERWLFRQRSDEILSRSDSCGYVVSKVAIEVTIGRLLQD
jgi:hypothetical protein